MPRFDRQGDDEHNVLDRYRNVLDSNLMGLISPLIYGTWRLSK